MNRFPLLTLCLLALALCAFAADSSASQAVGKEGGKTKQHTKDSLDTVKTAVGEKKAVLLDVREKAEWEAGHLQDAKLLALSSLKAGVKAEELSKLLPKDTIVYCHCAAGVRCLEAAEILREQGYDVRPLQPGYKDLLKAGFPQAPR